jgi:poly(A) polymerase
MLPTPLLKIAGLTRNTKFENDLFAVGGYVRDQILTGRLGDDVDIVTTGDAIELANLIFQAGIAAHPPVTYPRFGTALVVCDGLSVEIVTARRESYDPTSRKPAVETGTLMDDALRRDFTCNTLLLGLHDQEIRDPLGIGLSDLHAGILRTPRPAEETFRDDPLRMLRAIRFRWKLGFAPTDDLWDSIRTSRERLRIVSFERIRDEIVKMLMHPTAPDALNSLMECGLFEIIAPEFLAMVNCEQGKWHHLDVWDHTMLVLRNLPPDASLELRLAALFHDVAKPPTRSIDTDGNTRFFGHETEGASMTWDILNRWKFSNRTILRVANLVKGHMRLGTMNQFTTPAARRLIRDFDEDLPLLLDLVEADASSLRPGVRVMDLAPMREKLAATAVSTPASRIRSPLTGEVVMEILSVGPGPVIGAVQRSLEEQVIQGTFSSDDTEAARDWLRTHAHLYRRPHSEPSPAITDQK